MKPLIIFDGNCQSHHLAAIFAATGLADTLVNGNDFGLIPSFRGQLCRYADEDACAGQAAAAITSGRTVIQASQTTPMAEVRRFSYSAYATRVITFPYLMFTALKTGETATARPPARRIYETDLQLIRRCQDKVAIPRDFAGFIQQHQPHRSLFHMDVHPGPELTGMLFATVLEQLADLVADADPAIEAEIRRGNGINMDTQHPMPPALLGELGFTWDASYETYAEMIVAHREQRWAFLDAARPVHLEMFGHDTQFWAGDFKAGLVTGRQERARAAFERLATLEAGLISNWYLMYTYGGRDPEIVRRAERVFRGQRQLHSLFAQVASETGRHAEAVEHATAYRNAARDLIDGFSPLVLALCAAGDNRRADLEFQNFFYAAPPHRRDHMADLLVHHPGLTIRKEDLDFDRRQEAA